MLEKNRIFFEGFFAVAIILSGCIGYAAELNDTVTSDLINLSFVSDTVEIGDEISLIGTIDPALLGDSSSNMLLTIHSPYESRNDAFIFVTPDDTGHIQKNISADVTGTWDFSGKYGDLRSKTVEAKVIPRETLVPTSVTLTSGTGIVHNGDRPTITGWLKDQKKHGISGKTVTYEVAFPMYGCSGLCRSESNLLIWETLGTTSTDSIGKFSFTIPVSDSGIYSVRASFGGDEIYTPSKSPNRDISVS